MKVQDAPAARGPTASSPLAPARKPPWLKAPLPSGPQWARVRQLAQGLALHTVCEEAHCPNLGECWGRGTAAFMILGRVCTRACRFCAVTAGRPGSPPDPQEPARVAEAVARIGLRHVVVTSVARDDLPDGGAAAFAAVVAAIRVRCPGTTVEVLIPDLQGCAEPLRRILEAGPDILNHNVETCRRLTPQVRARARYARSLELLARARQWGPPSLRTKSGFMVGLGESWQECLQTMDDLRSAGVELLTVGQYLQPSAAHLPVVRYYAPEEFAALRVAATARGFLHCAAGPLVRSSYHADAQAAAAHAAATGIAPEIPAVAPAGVEPAFRP